MTFGKKVPYENYTTIIYIYFRYPYLLMYKKKRERIYLTELEKKGDVCCYGNGIIYKALSVEVFVDGGKEERGNPLRPFKILPIKNSPAL